MSISIVQRLSWLCIFTCAVLVSPLAQAQTAASQSAIANAATSSMVKSATALSVPEAYARAQQSGVILVDVREPQEWASGVASNAKGEVLARLLPMSQLQSRAQEIPNDPNQPIILICRTQNRSAEVAKQLIAKGYTNVSYVNGGMKEWGERQLPTAAAPK